MSVKSQLSLLALLDLLKGESLMLAFDLLAVDNSKLFPRCVGDVGFKIPKFKPTRGRNSLADAEVDEFVEQTSACSGSAHELVFDEIRGRRVEDVSLGIGSRELLKGSLELVKTVSLER